MKGIYDVLNSFAIITDWHGSLDELHPPRAIATNRIELVVATKGFIGITQV
jgi:hypothetical protein